METKKAKQIVAIKQLINQSQTKFVTKVNLIPSKFIGDNRKSCKNRQVYWDCSHDKQKCFMWNLRENGMCQHHRRRKFTCNRVRQGHMNQENFGEKMFFNPKIDRTTDLPIDSDFLNSLCVATMWNK